MLEVIQQLLILQDRDRQLMHCRQQLAHIAPQKAALIGEVDETKAALKRAKTEAKSIESARKELELQAESKESQIRKYSSQQLETRKNEEYKALSNEIEACRRVISDLEDEQLELLEQLDLANAKIRSAEAEAAAAVKLADENVVALESHSTKIQKELQTLTEERARLSRGIASSLLYRYERLLKSKGENSVVGVDRGVCGGCHVSLPVQIAIQCQGQKEVIHCPNCDRILYFADGMRRHNDD